MYFIHLFVGYEKGWQKKKPTKQTNKQTNKQKKKKKKKNGKPNRYGSTVENLSNQFTIQHQNVFQIGFKTVFVVNDQFTFLKQVCNLS